MSISSSATIQASYSSEDIVLGAGVAIFHIATRRVVVCWHSKEKYFFLPKGRKNVNEDIRAAAEREGYEESGYRNRLLPISFRHRQTQPDEGPEDFVTEALWIQLMPLTSTRQYLLHWYIAETLPDSAEIGYEPTAPYQQPPAYPKDLSIVSRIKVDHLVTNGTIAVYEPVKYEGTGVNEDESYYRSYLIEVDEAQQKLKGTVMADVIKRGWAAIQDRMKIESEIYA